MMQGHAIPGVVFQPRSQRGMQRGINQIVEAVRPTLGPRPRIVAVENVFREKKPEFLDKGGLIARRIIQLPDRDADMGAMLVRHALWRVHEEVGDATATAAVMFQAVYNRGLHYVAAGGNAVHLRRYLEAGLHEILQELDNRTLPVTGKERLARLAESLCFDASLAKLLGEIFDIVGEYGQVEIRRGHGREYERQYVEGMYWSSKILSPRMLTDQIKLRTDLTNTAILISDLELEDPRPVMQVLDQVMQRDIRSLLIVANKLSDSVIALLLSASREPQKFQVIAALTPGSGPVEQGAMMQELSILTGGRPVIQAAGDTLRSLQIDDLGFARRAWVDRSYLGIIGGKGDPRVLRTHMANLRAAFKAADDPQQRTKLQQRIAKLMGGSATLLVGGSTETEITAREELARQTSALVRAALREGVLPGGGLAFLACRQRLQRLFQTSSDPDQQAAIKILIRALEEPLRTIAANSGYDGGTVLGQVERAEQGCGFDARSGGIVDMAQAGILDVAAAQKAAIRCAVSGAATALTVDVLVHKKNPEQTSAKP
ncbi:MAG: hypothetical protein CYG59_03405 [Chloroflexi bacterium]|nr:MAG: hypothetical protein CYG59_03405 [Chloroflexota bacterium]